MTAAFIAAATAFGTGFGQSLFHTVSAQTEPSGQPVKIDSVTPNTDQEGIDYAFSRSLVLTGAELKSLNRLSPDDPSYDSWFTSRGGVVPSPFVMKIVVQGNRLHPVLITDMGVLIDRCTRPLHGALFANSSGGGTVADQAVVFDLDAPHPLPQNGLLNGNFFSAHSISLKKGELQVLKVVVNSSRYCLYRFRFTVVDGTRTVPEIVSNDGQPFSITAWLPGSQYRVLYIGGSIGVTGPLVRMNPATSKPY
jgi:hypothetical protein